MWCLEVSCWHGRLHSLYLFSFTNLPFSVGRELLLAIVLSMALAKNVCDTYTMH